MRKPNNTCYICFLLQQEKVDAGMGRVMRLNAPEWYFILLGCLAALINGGLMPAFAVIFAEILGVRSFNLFDTYQIRKLDLHFDNVIPPFF